MRASAGLPTKFSATRSRRYLFVGFVALCLTLFGRSPDVAAEPLVTERLRLQGGFITEKRTDPDTRLENVWGGVVPQLNLTWLEPSYAVSIDYQLTGALHSLRGMSEIANLLSLTGAFELSPRTRLLLFAEGVQSSYSNYLISRTAADTTLALYPTFSNRIITGRLVQGLVHELTPNWRVEQSTEAGVYTTLAPSPPLDTFFANVGAGVERSWRNDALGVEVRGGYTTIRALAPIPDAQFITLDAAPRWRRDWSPSLSSSLAVGGALVQSLDAGTSSQAVPFARAMLLYTGMSSTAELSWQTGIFPSLLTGLLVRTNQATLRVTTPLSEHHRVFAGGSVGYSRANIVDLRNLGFDLEYDSVLGDVDVSWRVTPLVEVFARYQFIGQVGDTNTIGINPSLLRDFVIVGIQLSSRPLPGEIVPRSFPQRVDRSDAPPGTWSDRARTTEEEREGDEGAEPPRDVRPAVEPAPAASNSRE